MRANRNLYYQLEKKKNKTKRTVLYVKQALNHIFFVGGGFNSAATFV